MEVAERFWGKVNKNGPHGCWLWTDFVTSTGYGLFNRRSQTVKAHRIAYELEVGPIPQGLTLDHLCRVRHCVNPSHLEVVDMKTNILRGSGSPAQNARQTHCPFGHPYDLFNTIIRTNGARRCRECNRRQSIEFRRRKLFTPLEV